MLEDTAFLESGSAESPLISDAGSILTDRFGRVHDSLRISVIDRCNIRCFYCMPEHASDFLPRTQLLSIEEIVRAVKILGGEGLQKIRLTGGEPLLRPGLDRLVDQLRSIDSIQDIALTTNGILLPRFAESLRDAGLQRLNISLDTLTESTFQKISRREGIQKVIDGIDHAISVGFDEIRLNALAIRDLTENEILPLVQFARRRNLTIRFIEYMPLDADRAWKRDSVLSGQEIRHRIEEKIGALRPVARKDPAQPAVDYEFVDGNGRIGLINPVTEPFCGNCNRLRLTADGRLQNCLFSHDGWDLKNLLRSGASNAEILAQARRCVAAKRPGHLISQPDFQQPPRAMYQIGG